MAMMIAMKSWEAACAVIHGMPWRNKIVFTAGIIERVVLDVVSSEQRRHDSTLAEKNKQINSLTDDCADLRKQVSLLKEDKECLMDCIRQIRLFVNREVSQRAKAEDYLRQRYKNDEAPPPARAPQSTEPD